MILGTVNDGDVLGKDFNIEKPFCGLAVVVRVASDSIGIKEDGTENFTKNLIEKIGNNITVSAYYKQKSGKGKYYFSAFNLMQLLELSQHEEGVVKVIRDGLDYVIKGYLPLSNTGAIAFNNDETMTVTVVGGKDFKYNMDLYTVELSQVAHDYLEYSRLSVLEGQREKKFDLRGYEKIMIPLSAISRTTIVSLDYTNGITCRYNREELEAMGLLINDVCYSNGANTVYGFGHHAILDCSNIVDVDIRRDSTTAFDIVAIKTRLVSDVIGSIITNEKLIDTTEQEKLEKLNAKLAL